MCSRRYKEANGAALPSSIAFQGTMHMSSPQPACSITSTSSPRDLGSPVIGNQHIEQQQYHQKMDSSESIDEDSKEARYRKTMTALAQAGLLDLTLKISELAKQNKTVQKDLDTLEQIVEATYMAVNGSEY